MPVRPLLALVASLAAACSSAPLAVGDRAVQDELAQLDWKPAATADLVGHWRVIRIDGPAAAVLMDIGYWIDADGHFSGAALFAGPPPTYEVLSGAWTLAADGALQLGEEAAPARAEIAQGKLRLSGEEGSLVFERAEVQ